MGTTSEPVKTCVHCSNTGYANHGNFCVCLHGQRLVYDLSMPPLPTQELRPLPEPTDDEPAPVFYYLRNGTLQPYPEPFETATMPNATFRMHYTTEPARTVDASAQLVAAIGRLTDATSALIAETARQTVFVERTSAALERMATHVEGLVLNLDEEDGGHRDQPWQK